MKEALHPGEILNEYYLKENGLTISKTATGIGISRQALSEIVNGKNGITAVTAVKLAKAFNTSARMWMNLQAEYDLKKAEDTVNLDEVQSLVTE